MKVRVSAGTAMYLGLMKGGAMEHPTTGYVMIPGGVCRGGCTFCPQARGDSKWLSRVSWPELDIDEIIEPLKNSDLERICIQCPDIADYEDILVDTVNSLQNVEKPISISTPPLSGETLEKLKDKIDRIGIGIDAATDEIRAKTKPKYDPRVFWDYLGEASKSLGPENVTAHFIVGLGENLPQFTLGAYRAAITGANISLFSYMSKDDVPDMKYYRQAQVSSHLLKNGMSPTEVLELMFERPEELAEIVNDGDIFRTQGCPGCNRPYYTTRPGDEHRNYPKPPTGDELEKIKEDLGL